MKVLMLGWEFPPHISGGLGTACHGLTRGLAVHGVDVLFVVPRAYGDEDQRSVRVLGANQVPLFERVVESQGTAGGRSAEVDAGVERAESGARGEPGSGASSPRPRAAVLAALADWERVDQSLELLAVDSLLTPYATEQSYGASYAASSGRGGAGVLAPGATALATEAAAARRVGARAAVEEFRRHLRQFRELAGEADAIVESLVERGTLEFSGLYGPNLISEVARFALVVGEIARGREFDVIHAHDWMAVPAGLVAKHVSGKPLVVHIHASEYDRSGEHVNVQVRDIEQLGLDGADLVVCVSHYTANLLQQRYRVDPAKLRVVHNAVTHRQQVEQLHVEKRIEEPIVLFLGRVTFQKGPDYFLEAAARVIKIEPKVKFVMSGSGDMLPVMVERAARLGLARHVHFTGFLKGADVERMYAMADIYVMPSVSEPFGISPLEAMALDVPVIMSRQSGVSGRAACPKSCATRSRSISGTSRTWRTRSSPY
jgi:glycogen synthase